MTSDPHGRHDEDGSGTSPIPRERMRWFTGRFVTARDLTDEQDYFLRRRWLLNRVLHREGVLCGMDVRGHPRADCRPTTVFVEPGIALDCQGRELVLDCRLCVTWPPADDPATATAPASPGAAASPAPATSATGKEPEPETVLLAVRYVEQDVAPRYAVQDACATSTVRRASRIRECVEYGLLSREEAPHCWPGHVGAIHNDCDEEARSRACLEPDCRCDGWVPLAVLSRRHGQPIGVHRLTERPVAATALTRIRRLGWSHGGSLSLDEIVQKRGRIEIFFDRRLRPADGDRTGINQFTFRVEMVGAQLAPELVPFERAPVLLADGTTAVFTIDPDLWDPARRNGGRRWGRSLTGQLVIVTLFCDFVLDCHGHPVDGDHLRGVVPTGNGTPGGVFRSWFTVS